MNPPDALQVLLITHADGAHTGDYPKPATYLDALRSAFLGMDAEESARDAALADPPKTGVAVRQFFVNSKADPPILPPVAAELNAALHTLVVVIVTDKLARDDAAVERLEEIAKVVRDAGQGKQHDLLQLGTNEAVLSALRSHPKADALNRRQGRSLETLTEYALRPAYAATLALHRTHRLLTRETGSGQARARFFISHAKLDGLSLAHSMRHTIERLDWLGSFYDARDIQPGDDWRQLLEEGVRDAMLLVLRTDVYDQRFWCRQEVMWAEHFDRPVLLVDARTQLLSRPSVLGFTGVPGVRIPDGNLVRVLAEGLREWVRIGVLRRRYEEVAPAGSALAQRTEFLSRPPSLASLVGALERLRAKGAPEEAAIVHSEPALESGYSDAAQVLIRSHFPKGAVLAFQTFLATLP